MSFIFKLLFVFVAVFMVRAKEVEEVVSTEEIEMLQKKLCDNDMSKESKDKLIDCMEDKLPFLLLESMDSCIYEAIPNAFTREEIQKSLCNSKEMRDKVHNCMKQKQKDLAEFVSKDVMNEKFRTFKACVASINEESGRDE